jgi:hypothetical protein
MTIRAPFKPHFGSNQNPSPAAASASITIGGGDKTLRIRNTGATNVMYFRTGQLSNGAVVATTADMPVYPGESVYIEKPQDDDTVATISALGTTASIMSGEGGY